MELGICYLYNENICGLSDDYITNQYIIYETFSYNKINTQRTINRKFKFVDTFRNYLLLNGGNNNTSIDIIKRIEIVDGYGYVVSCAIYYTYLLKIIQRRWRRFLQYRKIYLSSGFINHLRKRETSTQISRIVNDGHITGLLYR